MNDDTGAERPYTLLLFGRIPFPLGRSRARRNYLLGFAGGHTDIQYLIRRKLHFIY